MIIIFARKGYFTKSYRIWLSELSLMSHKTSDHRTYLKENNLEMRNKTCKNYFKYKVSNYPFRACTWQKHNHKFKLQAKQLLFIKYIKQVRLHPYIQHPYTYTETLQANPRLVSKVWIEPLHPLLTYLLQ